MKKVITLALALVMVFAMMVPCFAALTEADGVWTSEGNDQAVWMTGVTSKHFKVEGDFNDVNNGMNGCVGFFIGSMPEDAPFDEHYGICLFATGTGNMGYTAYCKWWSLAPSGYTVAEGEGLDRFAHIEVEWEATDDNVIVTFTCNDKTVTFNNAEKYPDEALLEAKSIVITEKITGGQVKNLKFTDLEEPETTDPGTGTEPKPTGTAAIVVSMVALVSLAAVTVVAKKRH